MHFEIITATSITITLQNQVTNLYKQLNEVNIQRPLSEVLDLKNNTIMAIGVADNVLVGMALLATYKVVSGYRGIIEDVVVDASHRGQGIGKNLMLQLLEEAKNQGLDEVLLFTGHHRTPAIALYTSLGFQKKESGLYTLKCFY